MFPKGLLFAIILGVISGPIFGIILYEYGVEDQLVYVDGTSLSIVTEKTNFTLGDPISIKIIINTEEYSGGSEIISDENIYGKSTKNIKNNGKTIPNS